LGAATTSIVLACCRVDSQSAPAAVISQAPPIQVSQFSRRQLVHQLRPLVLHHPADIIGRFRDALVVLRHDVVRDDPGLVDAASGHLTRLYRSSGTPPRSFDPVAGLRSPSSMYGFPSAARGRGPTHRIAPVFRQRKGHPGA
jgi:hypothetical protein